MGIAVAQSISFLCDIPPSHRYKFSTQVKDFAILLQICLCRLALTTEKVTLENVNKYINNLLGEGEDSGKGAAHLKKLRAAAL